MSKQLQTIRESFSSMRRDSKARHRDIAEKLAISEGELIAAHLDLADTEVILQATRLRSEWPDIVASLEALGEVMALTRNASCVHEKIGVYSKVSSNGHVGLVLGGAIDLRVFYSRWKHGFAVSETTEQGLQQSLQFFDSAGVAVHKVFLKAKSNTQAYSELVARFKDEQQQAEITLLATPAAATEKPDEEIDVAGFRESWGALRDTHDFFGLLKQFGVSRKQGLRLADAQYVQQVDTTSAQQILADVAHAGVGIMVFVSNPGMIQIHSGVVHKVALMGPWINVLDPDFNLHLREDHIASAWVVKKPTVDGLVTSLELFDKNDEVIAMFFGERKPGKPELCQWRALIENLLHEQSSPQKSVSCAA